MRRIVSLANKSGDFKIAKDFSPRIRPKYIRILGESPTFLVASHLYQQQYMAEKYSVFSFGRKNSMMIVSFS